jgi:hypothetical protein
MPNVHVSLKYLRQADRKKCSISRKHKIHSLRQLTVVVPIINGEEKTHLYQQILVLIQIRLFMLETVFRN